MTRVELLKLALRAIQWRMHVAESEMIQAPGWYKSHFSDYPPVSQEDLDRVCVAANGMLSAIGLPYRLANHMGEILRGDKS